MHLLVLFILICHDARSYEHKKKLKNHGLKKDIQNFEFPSILSFMWIQNGSEQTLLAPTNDVADDVNRQLIKKIPGAAREYKLVDMLRNAQEVVNYPREV